MPVGTKKAAKGKKLRVIGALAAGASHAEAARIAGCCSRSVDRWATEPDVQEALAGAQAETIARCARVLLGKVDDAIGVLVREMKTADSSQARIRAATTILEQASKYAEGGDVARYLRQVQEAEAQRADGDEGRPLPWRASCAG